MKFAMQDAALVGATLAEKFTKARALGLHGVEVRAGNTLALAAAVTETGVKVSAVNVGHTRLLHPDYAEREAAIVTMREAMSQAVDLKAQGVVFQPHYMPGAVLPDLHPYKSAVELEAELLTTQLRATLCDLAYAMGTELLLQPVNHQETHLIRRVEHAVLMRRKQDDHPHLKIAASLYHMSCEGEDIPAVLKEYASDLGYLYLSDPVRGLPDDAAVAALRESGYEGWVCLDVSSGYDEAALADLIRQLKDG